MLVLMRKVGQKLQIGPDITVEVTRLKSGRVSLAIDAPRSIRIRRGELVLNLDDSNDSADTVRKNRGDSWR